MSDLASQFLSILEAPDYTVERRRELMLAFAHAKRGAILDGLRMRDGLRSQHCDTNPTSPDNASTSRTDYTPGPWTATHTDPAEGYDCWWITACPAPNQEKEVATVSGGFPHDRHEANARLIAAAPELLDLLEKANLFVGWAYTRGQVVAGVHAEELVDAIDAALAKARGEVK